MVGGIILRHCLFSNCNWSPTSCIIPFELKCNYIMQMEYYILCKKKIFCYIRIYEHNNWNIRLLEEMHLVTNFVFLLTIIVLNICEPLHHTTWHRRNTIPINSLKLAEKNEREANIVVRVHLWTCVVASSNNITENCRHFYIFIDSSFLSSSTGLRECYLSLYRKAYLISK